MTNLDSIFKSRDITLPTKVRLVKAMVFPVVMYGCESWILKKAERQRIDAFELWCWRRLLRIPWTAKRSNQSILKEISPEYSLEGLVLKLKESENQSCSVISNFLWPHGLYNPWNSPGQNTEWVAFPFSSGFSQPRDGTQVSHIAGRFFTIWATREA